MTCQRCSGRMMPHALCDWEDTYMKIPAWRCVNCGEVIDAVILQHRGAAIHRRRKSVLHHSPLQTGRVDEPGADR